MAQLEARQPSKICRGTIDEVFSHRTEISPDATVELQVFELTRDPEEGGAFGGKSILEAFPDLFGTEHGGPSDISERPRKYMADFGETKSPRSLGT